MPRTDHSTGDIPRVPEAVGERTAPEPTVGPRGFARTVGARPVSARDRTWQLLRFGVVGVLGTAVNVAILHVLHYDLGWGFTRSSALATELAIVHNYVWNELWTFHIRELHLGRLARYNMSSLLAASVTVAVATVVKEFIDAHLAQLVGIVAGAGLNYIVNVRWTWGPGTALGGRRGGATDAR